MPIFLVQDSDRPAFVLAGSWSEAIERWKVLIAKENDESANDIREPDGVSKIADDDEIVISRDWLSKQRTD